MMIVFEGSSFFVSPEVGVLVVSPEVGVLVVSPEVGVFVVSPDVDAVLSVVLEVSLLGV